MPLHLLPKKSWNVYNTANIERVRRDEAAAAAAEEAAEQRMQEIDSARRTALLRGEKPPPSPTEPETGASHQRYDGTSSRGKKRRRLHGEDETDWEMRNARENAAEAEKARERMALSSSARSKAKRNEELVDSQGHTRLFFPADSETTTAPKKPDTEPGLRFRDAAGYQHHADAGRKPWYASTTSTSTSTIATTSPEKPPWGDPDPRRRERETARLKSSDPFAAMQAAQRQLKQSVKDRERWVRMRAAEEEEDGLEDGFRLDYSECRGGKERRSEERRRRRSREGEGEGRRRRHDYQRSRIEERSRRRE